MRLKSFITEKRRNDVIVVDVQPSYKSYIDFSMLEFCEFLNGCNNILYFYNGMELCLDNESQVRRFLYENGFDKWKMKDIQFVDKTYGFLRGWMDMGIDVGIIKKAIRYMMSKRENDSRDIPYEEWLSVIPDLGDYEGIDSEPIYLPSFSMAQLKSFQGSYLVGGGRNECLKEVEILLSTFNIHVIKVERFIYG